MTLSNRIRARAAALWSSSSSHNEGARRAALIEGATAAAWFIATFAAMVWVWGIDTEALASPDEALNRLAAAVLSQQGRPFLKLPFVDPEDLAHPRHWVSVGDYAIPSYPPVAIYGYALLLRLGKLGLVLITALPAAAAGAFAAGLTKLLPRDRAWLALPAPLLAFPALYWLMRPWVNLSVLLTCVCWAVFFWAAWRRSGEARQLTCAMLSVGAAAAVRPDYAAYLLLVALILGIAASPTQWKRMLALVVAAGAGAVGLNLLLNWQITGKPLLAAYQIVAARDEGVDATASPGGLFRLLRQLLLQMELPTPAQALAYLARYWLEMGAIAALTLAQLALLAPLRKKSWPVRGLYLLALLVMLGFMLSHMDPKLNGANEREGLMHHSMPRYWSPLFLLAVVPPLAFLGACKRRAVFVGGAALWVAAAGFNAYELFAAERFSLLGLAEFQQESEENVAKLARSVPAHALVYSAGYDKILWARWRVATLGQPRSTARSLARAWQAKQQVFVYEPSMRSRHYRRLNRVLLPLQLKLVKARQRGVYRLEREPPSAGEPSHVP